MSGNPALLRRFVRLHASAQRPRRHCGAGNSEGCHVAASACGASAVTSRAWTLSCVRNLCSRSGSDENHVLFKKLETNACSGGVEMSGKLCPAEVSAARQYWVDVLRRTDVPEPEDSVRHILAHVLQCSLVELERSRPFMTAEQLQNLETLMCCRIERMPVQYIVGGWDFYNISLYVCPPVFIPRPETEGLVEEALKILQSQSKASPVVLDLCTGSGAVSLALLKANQMLRCVAVDRSKKALSVAAHNAKTLGLDERISLLHLELEFGESLELPEKSYDVIVSNPPYVLDSDLLNVAPEIYLYEDLRALRGGPDGLTVVKAVLWQAAHYLATDGNLFVEIDPKHQQLLPVWLETETTLNKALKIERFIKDFAGRIRIVHLKRK